MWLRRCSGACPFPKQCQILLHHRASAGGGGPQACRLLSRLRRWEATEGTRPLQGPQELQCAEGPKGKVTSPSQAGGHAEMRLALCFVRANSLKTPKRWLREG